MGDDDLAHARGDRCGDEREDLVAREMAGFISTEVDRTNSLVTRFLDFARPLELHLEKTEMAEVIDEGHKALVFSQFTSLLSIVRRQLDREGTVYEYLDGRTVKRQAKVERF